MRRFIATFAAACALAVAVHAQDTTVKTETKQSGAAPTTVSYTGCVQTGTEARTFVLNKIVPVARTTTTEVGAAGTSGTVTNTTTYALVPDEKITIQEHVGHKVEVTGTMMPAGDSKTETTTKIERDDAPDTKTKETVKTENAMPQFKVTSIKQLAERCE